MANCLDDVKTLGSDEDRENQEDEMVALESIFQADFVFNSSTKPISGHLKVNLDLEHPINITDGSDKVHPVSFLPPITIYFVLPSNYPSLAPPNFTLSSSFLDREKLSVLCRGFDSLWESSCGMGILFSWGNWLKDALSSIQLSDNTIDLSKRGNSELDDRAVREPSTLKELIDYNEGIKNKTFENGLQSCEVCYEDKPGRNCSLLPCGHIFCTECLRQSFTLSIQEGTLESVACLAYKCDKVPTPGEVKKIVGEEMFKKYDEKLLSLALDTMDDVLHCPRRSCGKPVVIEQNELSGSCTTCGYVFCIRCFSVFHGVDPCKFKSQEAAALYEKYTNADEKTRAELEKKYGSRQISLLVNSHLSESWLKENSKLCPHCKAKVEKYEGCNKVTCKCGCMFCWLCGKQVDKLTPYFHFNDSSSECFNRLFEGVNVDQDEFQFDFINNDDEQLDPDDNEDNFLQGEALMLFLNAARRFQHENNGEPHPNANLFNFNR